MTGSADVIELDEQALDSRDLHVHDLQATVLHCLGFDHERLTFPHAGRDYRLTDVHGRVVPQLLARAARGEIFSAVAFGQISPPFCSGRRAVCPAAASGTEGWTPRWWAPWGF